MTNPIVQTEAVIIGLLLLSALVAYLTQRWGIPYTVGLVLVGLGVTFLGHIEIQISPQLILALLVPPLVFEASFHLNFSELRRELPLILMLAIPGVILTTLLVGGLVSFAAGIALPYAMVFGALIAATDPVAVVALFRSLGVPKRLQVLLEGESLLNDGTAVVIFNLMVGVAVSGQFSLGDSIVQFFIVAGGGVLVGGLAGYFVSRVIGRIDNYLIETTLTTILAYGSYLIAEYVFGVSGLLAVVAAGIASGVMGPKGMSPTTRIVVSNFWETVAFLANSFIFLIIGLQIDLNSLVTNASAILWGILAVLIARAVTVYGLSLINRDLPWRWKNILFWGGLRGAISLALVISLSTAIPNRSQLQAMAFGVVLFTVVVEGLTMKPLIRWSKINTHKDLAHREYEQIHAREIAQQAVQNHLSRLNREGLLSQYTWDMVKPLLEKQLAVYHQKIQKVLDAEPQYHQEELADAWKEALRVQRNTYSSLYRKQRLSEEVYTDLIVEIDTQLGDPQSTWSGLASLEDGDQE